MAEEQALDHVLDPVAHPVEGQEHADGDGRVDEGVLLPTLDAHEVIRRPFDQAEACEQDRADDGVDQGAVHREADIDDPVAQHGVGEHARPRR